MKRSILTVVALALVLGAGSLIAADTNWQGTYFCMDQGTWTGTIYDDPTGPDKPHFEGKWVSIDEAKWGTMYATLKSDGLGNYTIVKGTLFNEDGQIGTWGGKFSLMTKPGVGKGDWTWFYAPYIGSWEGKLAP
jgi:hypothetical protein